MDHDWEKEPVRHDPRRGYKLCRSCWDGKHWNKPYRDKHNVHHPKTSNCMFSKFQGKGECGCGCTDPGPKRVKFTGLGQVDLFDLSVSKKQEHVDDN